MLEAAAACETGTGNDGRLPCSDPSRTASHWVQYTAQRQETTMVMGGQEATTTLGFSAQYGAAANASWCFSQHTKSL